MTNTPKATPRDYLDLEIDFNVTINTIQGVMDLLSSVEPNNVPAENLAKIGNGMYRLAEDADRLFTELLRLHLAERKKHKAQEAAHGCFRGSSRPVEMLPG